MYSPESVVKLLLTGAIMNFIDHIIAAAIESTPNCTPKKTFLPNNAVLRKDHKSNQFQIPLIFDQAMRMPPIQFIVWASDPEDEDSDDQGYEILRILAPSPYPRV
jgi:hypothetical protein